MQLHKIYASFRLYLTPFKKLPKKSCQFLKLSKNLRIFTESQCDWIFLDLSVRFSLPRFKDKKIILIYTLVILHNNINIRVLCKKYKVNYALDLVLVKLGGIKFQSTKLMMLCIVFLIFMYIAPIKAIRRAFPLSTQQKCNG